MRVGSIGYACSSGLGHLNKWFFENHVTDRVFMVKHPEYASHMEWFPGAPSTPLRRPNLDAVVKWVIGADIDVLLCYETPFFWKLMPTLRDLDVKLAMMPMHEWFPEDRMDEFDLYLCPSALDFDIFKKDRGRAVQVTVPVDPSTWRRRTKVRRFLHNAGHVGHREHKGTRQLLEAMRHVTKPIDLTVRGQGRELLRMVHEWKGPVASQAKLTVNTCDVSYSEMFPEEFDAYVAPEKFNGLSLPLQEAWAAGMLVVTTDRYPTNTWLPEGPWMIAPEGYIKAKVCTSCVEVDEAIVSPKQIAATLDALYGMDIADYSDSGLEWAKANSWDVWAPRYRSLLEELL